MKSTLGRENPAPTVLITVAFTLLLTSCSQTNLEQAGTLISVPQTATQTINESYVDATVGSKSQ